MATTRHQKSNCVGSQVDARVDRAPNSFSAGHTINQYWKLSASRLNATNHRVLEDNSVTIGGFHFNNPRMISAELRCCFHF